MKNFQQVLSMLCLGLCIHTPIAFADSINESDPWEPMNRVIYAGNKRMDTYFLKPVARVYKFVLPSFAQSMVHNFFSNLHELPTIGNNVLQLKPRAALKSTSRFLINSTFGFVGFGDPASQMGLEQHREDFGQTLVYWGYKNSRYLMLPVLGPSTVRDSLGLGADYYMMPYAYMNKNKEYYAAGSTEVIQKRSELLDQEKSINAVAVDEYVLIRDAYFQRREYLNTDKAAPPDLEDYSAN